jgi:hypothetical protein
MSLNAPKILAERRQDETVSADLDVFDDESDVGKQVTIGHSAHRFLSIKDFFNGDTGGSLATR